MSFAWSLLAWGGLVYALKLVWTDQRGVARGAERTLFWGLALLGFALTWSFMILMAREDIARYSSLADWSTRSNLFFDAYRRVSDSPAAWWWSQQLILWAPAAVLFFHAESAPRRRTYWPYIWVGLCIAISAALPLFLLRHQEGNRPRARLWTGLCLTIAALAGALLPEMQGERFFWCILTVHVGVLLSPLPIGKARISPAPFYLLFALIAALSWWHANLWPPAQLWQVIWKDPAQSSISLDVMVTIAVCLVWIARKEGGKAALLFAAAALFGSLGAAFCLYRLGRLSRSHRAVLNDGFPGSQWGNLGLWTEAQTYPEACEALAVRLAEHAGLAPGSRLLDVGFGYGDQLLLWRHRFAVGPITGIEIDEDGLAAARGRLADAALSRDEWGGGHDHVLALDCAYHFAPRRDFLGRARQALVPGGTLALTDLVVARKPGRIARALAGACAIPAENLLTRDAYEAELRELGFEEVRIEPLGDVLDGFARFARRGHGGNLRILVTAAALRWLAGEIGYVVVAAKTASVSR